MGKAIIFVLTLAVLAAPEAAGAAKSAQEFLGQSKDQKERTITYDKFAKLWLAGVYYGIAQTNVELMVNNRRPVFCPPKNMGLSDEQVVDILRQYVESNPGKGAYSVGLVLMHALKDAYPCTE